MPPKRKRTTRLVVSLTAAVLLASALVYTSFNASSEARSPSQLRDATAGRSYQLTGRGGREVIVTVRRRGDVCMGSLRGHGRLTAGSVRS